jgi:hypothetical protein
VSNKFAAIPDIGNTVDSLRDACQAMKQMLETLTQQRGAVNKPAGAVTFADLIAMGVIDSQYIATAGTGPWTAYTPVITAGTGAFTTVSATGRYTKIGKTILVNIIINITTNGSAAGFIQVSLPFIGSPTGSSILVGREDAIAGKMLQCRTFVNANTAIITNYDNTYPGLSGALIELTGAYEAV